MPEHLRRVDDERHRPERRRHVRHRLGRPHLVVRGLQRGRGDAAAAAAADRNASASTRASRSTPIGTAVPPCAACHCAACRTAECSTVLCTSAPLRGAGQRAEHRGVQGLRPVRREADLVRPGAERVGERFAGRVEQQPGPPARSVEPGRVGPAVVQRGEQGLARHRVQRRPGGGVEIGTRHGPDGNACAAGTGRIARPDPAGRGQVQ